VLVELEIFNTQEGIATTRSHMQEIRMQDNVQSAEQSEDQPQAINNSADEQGPGRWGSIGSLPPGTNGHTWPHAHDGSSTDYNQLLKRDFENYYFPGQQEGDVGKNEEEQRASNLSGNVCVLSLFVCFLFFNKYWIVL
jgi:hypothetical protein